MAKGCTTSKYEEARKQRLEENKKRFEDLGISRISKNLTEFATPKKTPQHHPKPKSKSNGLVLELRRSSRVRNSVPSYRDDVGIDLSPSRKRFRSSSSAWGSYVARPLDELKEATEEERNRAFEAAEALQSNLDSSNPSFIKSMVRSHVYSCFWLGLPTRFCEEHLPKTICDMVLEDENGSEYEAVFIGNRTGLSGGWRAFALDHKLDDGDALVFELIEPARFKIYIIKAFPDSVEDGQEISEEEGNTSATKKQEKQSNKTQKQKQGIVHETNESASSQEHLPESNVDNEVEPQAVNPAKKTRFSLRKLQKESKDAKIAKATKKQEKQSNMTQKQKQGIVHETNESASSQEHLAESNVDNEVEPQAVNPAKKTRFSLRKLQKESKDAKLPDADDSKREGHIEEGKNCATEKPNAAVKHKSQANKTMKSKNGILHENGDSTSTQQPESNLENEAKTSVDSPNKQNGLVEHADSDLKKVEPVEEAGEGASQKSRKKRAPKLFRKKA